jgi:hypothetical protein
MVSPSQSAFVKKSCIHDNFVLVQNIAKELHRKKVSSVFIKLDIVKAFDSISWTYLLELLQRLGFGAKRRDWVTLALSTSSSRILLNGTSEKPIKHERGLRQGDPISPMLFILAMDPLHKLLQRAAESGILSLITPRSSGIKVSLYADDAAIFAKPTKNDLGALKEILDMFRRVSDLRTNLQKKKYSRFAAVNSTFRRFSMFSP